MKYYADHAKIHRLEKWEEHSTQGKIEHQNECEKNTGRLTSTLKEKAQAHKENFKSTIIRPLQKTEAHNGLGQGEDHQMGVQVGRGHHEQLG